MRSTPEQIEQTPYVMPGLQTAINMAEGYAAMTGAALRVNRAMFNVGREYWAGIQSVTDRMLGLTVERSLEPEEVTDKLEETEIPETLFTLQLRDKPEIDGHTYGKDVFVSTVQESDRENILNMLDGLDPRSKRFRFCGTVTRYALENSVEKMVDTNTRPGDINLVAYVYPESSEGETGIEPKVAGLLNVPGLRRRGEEDIFGHEISIVVSSDARRQGLALKLMKAGLDMTGEMPVEILVDSANHPTRSLMAKLGQDGAYPMDVEISPEDVTYTVHPHN